MRFEWDPAKAKAVQDSRGISFFDIARLFDSAHVVIPSDKMGEARWRIVGRIDGVCVTGVFTRRGDVFRIITARRFWKNEEREYGSLHAG